jgi:glyoxylase-like metal-dependent hydrolase (beta-lactamase superfamily II)
MSADGIYEVDTNYIRAGKDASHIILNNGRAAFVDSGPGSGIPYLLGVLAGLGIAPEQVDYVLLTHVHLDHAGGAGLLLQSLPNAKAVIHPRGARHLIDPAKLVEGSIAVYGETRFRELYGQIVPIPAERVVQSEDGMQVVLGDRELELIHTPGHALHHYCVIDRQAECIFSGDTFGISYRQFDTAAGEFIFPTTTPVHFDPQALHASIDRLMGYRPKAIYLTHFSRVTQLQRLAADMHECIDGFVAIARRHSKERERGAHIRSDLFAYLQQRLDGHGFRASRATLQELLATDVELNSQGLEVWLDRGAPG